MWKFLKAVGKQFGWLLGILGLTILRFWKPVFGKELPNWLFWLCSCICLLLACFFAWRVEHRARIHAESLLLSPKEKELLARAYKIHKGLLELMWKWPTSPCVLTPISISWRPLVGTTDISADVQATMAWHKEAIDLIEEAQKLFPQVFPEITVATPFPKPGIQASTCLWRFTELEEMLTRKVLASKPPPASTSD
jgi:hypothetical protein